MLFHINYSRSFETFKQIVRSFLKLITGINYIVTTHIVLIVNNNVIIYHWGENIINVVFRGLPEFERNISISAM